MTARLYQPTHMHVDPEELANAQDCERLINGLSPIAGHCARCDQLISEGWN